MLISLHSKMLAYIRYMSEVNLEPSEILDVSLRGSAG